MAYCSSYYLYQRYEKRGNQNWLPSYPNVYSIDGEGSQPLRARQMYDTECGWIPDTEVQYRTVSGTPYCSGETGYDKYVYETYQVSYDGGITWSTTGTADVLVERNSPDCGYVPPIEPIYRWVQITPISGDSSTYVCDECQITPIYRWENSGTTCVNCDKYQRTIKQVSYDNGSTWENVSPAEYSATTLIEANSYDCGYRTRTTSGTPYCSGYNKYVDVYSQVSYDSGSTWSTTATTATITEPCSDDCMASIPYENQYLTFVPLEECTFRCDITSCQYSLDCGLTWNWFYQDSTVTTNQKVLVRHSEWTSDPSSIVGFQFSSTGRFKVQGNIMSLMYGDNFTGKTTIPYPHLSFMSTFSGCTNLVDAENLVLPATSLTDYCYDAMFQDCTSLIKSPRELPATTLSYYCYGRMFAGCTSLTTTPAIYGMTLANYCYERMFAGCTSLVNPTNSLTFYTDNNANYCFSAMFSGCTSLTSIPELGASTHNYMYDRAFKDCTSLTGVTLPFTSIANGNVYQMFDGCSNLSYVKCNATYIDSGSSYCWLRGVAATGTFAKNYDTTWVRGESGIPINWTVQNA